MFGLNWFRVKIMVSILGLNTFDLKWFFKTSLSKLLVFLPIASILYQRRILHTHSCIRSVLHLRSKHRGGLRHPSISL